jgi:acylphosphatase
MQHVNIKVFGDVQGVFFRHFTKKTAETLGIKGFVRNLDDGTVYIEAEGDEQKLREFSTWCNHGPPGASVLKIVQTPSQDCNGFSEFEIRY